MTPLPVERLPWRRRLIYSLATLASLGVSILALLLVADLYPHHLAARSAGLNVRGYRGPVVGAKRDGETRVVVLGGSTVFGYGNPWDEAFPALLERLLNAGNSTRRWTVVNLGFNAEGVYALVPTLDDFAGLDAD